MKFKAKSSGYCTLVIRRYSGDEQGLSREELELVYNEGVLAKLLARNMDDSASKIPLDALLIPDIER